MYRTKTPKAQKLQDIFFNFLSENIIDEKRKKEKRGLGIVITIEQSYSKLQDISVAWG